MAILIRQDFKIYVLQQYQLDLKLKYYKHQQVSILFNIKFILIKKLHNSLTDLMFQCIRHNNPAYKFKILDYTYTSEPSINSALPLKNSTPKLLLYILGILVTAGFLWLLVKWSNKRKAILLYDVCSLEEATHFLVEEEEIVGGSQINQRIDRFDIRTRKTCISFNYHQRVYLFHDQKQAFLPIRYQQLGIHLDQLRKNVFQPYSKNLRPEMCAYYGQNIIQLPVQTKLQIFIQQMLTPYEVFQTYAIILWIFEEYYIFSFILAIYAFYTYWQTSSQVVENQVKLSKQSYFQIQCRILVNQNDNIGAINLNDQAQIQRITVIDKQNMQFSNSQNKAEMNEQNIQHQVQLATIYKKRDSHSQISRSKSFFDKHKVKSYQINSKQLLPGDLLILHQGDILPCDCIILKGQAIVDQSYVTGQKHLTRKSELQNFTYQKQTQNNFTLYLGTKISLIKNRIIAKPSFLANSLEQSIACHQFSSANQVICIVINTNYNTLRGKYLRAIRHQKKQQQSFTRQTIYFIYILVGLTIVVFAAMFHVISQKQSKWALFKIFLDLLSTSIPPTLPTLLSVGINFAQHRLKSADISCVLPSNILIAGKVDTIVLQGHHALGKDYAIECMVVGNKQGQKFGETYSSVQKFYNYYECCLETSSSSLQQTNKKKHERSAQQQFGTFFISCLSVCHSLQYFQGRIQGPRTQKKIFQFSQSEIQSQNIYLNKNHKIHLQKKIYFKEREKKLAVVVRIQQDEKLETHRISSQRSIRNQLEKFSLIDQDDDGLAIQGNRHHEATQVKSQLFKGPNPNRRVLFIKGPPQKILANCNNKTYPSNFYEYIVDMAQKGFTLTCYAYLPLPDQSVKSSSYYLRQIQKNQLTFLGFLVMKQIRYQDNLQAISAFKNADIKVLLVSEQRELQTSSIGILNKICEKKELLLCSYLSNSSKVFCKGHVEWESMDSEPITQFCMQFQDFAKNSYLSLTAPIYEELFMRRDFDTTKRIFDKSLIFNGMEYKHQRNLYSQLERRSNVSFAVGGGGIVSECANLSMELQRDQSSLLSSFYTKSKSLMTIFHCLRICRAGLATNFHVFSMMILFSLIQFTTCCLLYVNYQSITDSQMLYEDLFVTFPIFVALNLTKPSSRLSKQRPMTSFFDVKVIVSMIGQIIMQFLAQLGFILYLLSFPAYQHQKHVSQVHYTSAFQFKQKTVTSLATFVLSNYLYLGIVLSTSISKPFRKPFYTNPYYTMILILLWIYNTLIVVLPGIATNQIRRSGLTNDQESVLVLAMIFGNLMMMLMYLYQNLLHFLWLKYQNYIRNQHHINNSTLDMHEVQIQSKI